MTNDSPRLMQSEEQSAPSLQHHICTHCESPDTNVLTWMRRHSYGLEDWVRCNECGHLFTTRRGLH